MQNSFDPAERHQEMRMAKKAFRALVSCSFSIFLLYTIPVFSQTKQPEAVPGEFIVKLRGQSAGLPVSNQAAKLSNKLYGKAQLKGSFAGSSMHHFKANPSESSQVMSELRNDPDVEFVEPNYYLRKMDYVVGQQGEKMTAMQVQEMMAQYHSQSTSFSQNSAAVKVSESWQTISGGTSAPVVAIIDTGLDYNHDVFHDSGAVWTNPNEIAYNGIDDDGNGYIDDVIGWNFNANNNNPMDDEDHGTHVSGIVLGVTQDILAVHMDVAKIKIMPLKFLGADGSGTTSAAISAIYYAVNNGAKVINNSWGGPSYSQALHNALTYAYDHSVLVVAAAGNYASNNDTSPLYPASFPIPGLISVAATSDYDNLASFSNFGKSTVHVAAPGVSILSSVRSNSYSYMSGTSMAAPFVTGLASLVVREAPNLSAYQVRNLILNSGDAVSGLSQKTITGMRVNTLTSVVNAKSESSAQSYQPGYAAESREPASDGGGKKGGCGMVQDVSSQGPGGGQNTGTGLGFVLVMPLLVWMAIRLTYQRRKPHEKRRFERFVMHTAVKVSVAGKEILGELNTISLGGVSFQSDSQLGPEALDYGHLVALNIQSPDGHENIEVKGKIVWNAESRKYGVQFQDASLPALQSIQTWVTRFVSSGAKSAA